MEITKEMIVAARDYVPVEEKDDWVGENAQKCFDRLSITQGKEELPPMYMANATMKAQYLMAAFAGMYLRQEYEADARDPAMMSVAEIDNWAGSHALNQVERWKKDADVRDKCYDLLADYKDLEKRFAAQMQALLSVQNDSVMRQAQYMSTQMQDFPKLLEELKNFQQKKVGETQDAEHSE